MPIPLAHLGTLPHLHPHAETPLFEWTLPLLFGSAALAALLYALRRRRSQSTTSSSETWEKSSKNSPTA